MGQVEVSGRAGCEERREAVAGAEEPRRKAFVEPEVTSPVEVLEATTFFQIADSGGLT